jgi:hypothetical protein
VTLFLVEHTSQRSSCPNLNNLSYGATQKNNKQIFSTGGFKVADKTYKT